MRLTGSKFVVTGGAGFIGSHIAEELINQGKTVITVDNMSNGSTASLPPGVSNHRIDIRDHPIDQLVMMFSGIDTVFHNAAAKCTVCRDNPRRDLDTNAWGTWRVAKAAEMAGAKLIHASTGSVYGNEANFQREDNQYAPVSFYGVSKLAGEQYLRCFPELRWVALRYFHVFGPRQDASENGGVIPTFITKMLKKEPITVYGDGEQTRSFTYVKDVVKANLISTESDMMEGHFYNVASGVSITLNTLIEMLSEIIGVNPKVIYEPERPGDIKEFNVDNSKIAAEGMDEWTSFEDGLKETVEYYASARTRTRF